MLLLLATLILWSLTPVVVGWQPRAVLTGSMAPAVNAGDIVVTVPVAPADVAAGQVIAFTDATRPGRVVLHRVVRLAADGTFTTRGDANPHDDSTPVHPDQVLGVARVRIPQIARPLVEAHAGNFGTVALTAALIAAATLIAPDPVSALTDRSSTTSPTRRTLRRARAHRRRQPKELER
ncbi:signal peptidase I [Cellulomonas sp. NPDC055163]